MCWPDRNWILLLAVGLPLIGFSQSGGQTHTADLFDDLPVNDPSALSRLRPGESASQKINDNIFIRACPDRSTCYLGEQITVTWRLYTALKSTSVVSSKPSTVGCIARELQPDANHRPVKVIKGKTYQVFDIWKLCLTPLQPGKWPIDPLEVSNQVGYTDIDGRQCRYEGKTVSQMVLLTILPLPAKNKPVNFEGAVGEFHLHAHLTSVKLEAGEQDTLVLDVTGKGNFDNLIQPPIHLDNGITPLEAVEKWYPGGKQFCIPLAVLQKGDYSIPVSFSWFDPRRSSYRSVEMKLPALRVLPARQPAHTGAPLVNSKTVHSFAALLWWLAAGALSLLAILILFSLYIRSPKLKEKT